VLFLQK